MRETSIRVFILGAFITSVNLVGNVICTIMHKETGHLMPFGSSGKNIPVHRIAGFPHSTDFLDEFAKWRKPVVMEGAIKDSRSFVKWTDKYLRSVADNEPTYVNFESPIKNVHWGEDFTFISLQKFLDVYNSSNIYVMDDIPDALATDVLQPCPLQCPSLWDSLHNSLNSLWFSSGGTKTLAHFDPQENILCSVRGRKHLTMVDADYGLQNFPIDWKLLKMPLLDVDKVDLNKFPIFSEVDFQIANLNPGDCVYIPDHWIHQVNSYGSNIGLNFWWYREATEEALASGSCRDAAPCKPDFHFSDIPKYSWSKPSDGDFCYPVNFLQYHNLTKTLDKISYAAK